MGGETALRDHEEEHRRRLRMWMLWGVSSTSKRCKRGPIAVSDNCQTEIKRLLAFVEKFYGFLLRHINTR